MKQDIHSQIKSLSVFPGLTAHGFKTMLKDIVSLKVSFAIAPLNFSTREKRIASLAAGLLDYGTTKKSKETLRNLLEERGASISFGSEGKWLTAHVHAMRDDLPFIIGLAGEMLSFPAFKSGEVDLIKKQTHAFLEEAKSSTRTQAQRRFLSSIYSPEHINWMPSLEEEQKILKAISTGDIKKNHKERYSRSKGHLVAVGDVDINQIVKASKSALKSLKDKPTVEVPVQKNRKIPQKSREIISIPDQASVDVRIGHALSITANDPSYYPLAVLIDMLGGGFSAHLMQTVRERDGLTYGIYSNLAGFGDTADGWWQVGATFAPQLFLKGEEITLQEIRNFLTTGITEETVRSKKEEILGSYQIGLSTSGGLAGSILTDLEEDKPLSFIDEYVDVIEKITLFDVQKAAKLIDLSRLSIVAAGSIDKNGKAL